MTLSCTQRVGSISNTLSTRNINRESVDNAINYLGKFMQRVEDRMAFERLPLSKRYLEGGVKILVDININRRGHIYQYQAILDRADINIIERNKRAAVVRDLHVFNPCVVSCGNECFMFIGNVEVMDGSKHVIPSLVRLQRLNYLDDIFSGSAYVSFFDGSIKAIKTVCEREVNILGVSSVHFNKINSQKVEGGTEVMDNIPDDCGKIMRNLIPDLEHPLVMKGFGILLDNNSVRFRLDVIDDTIIELNDMAFGPINF